jgi:hypothetical protein
MKKIVTIIIFIAFGVFLVAGSASALLTFRATQGATQLVIADGSAGDANSNAGVVTFIGTVGNFVINVSTGLSKPVVGNPPFLVSMDLNSINSSTGAGGTLLLELSDNDFTFNLPSPTPTFQFNASIGGTTDGTLDFYKTYIGYDDVLFSQGSLITSQGPFSPTAFSGTTTGIVAADFDQFALTQVVQITHPAAGSGGALTSSFDANLTSVPEPTTLSLYLIGTGLVGLAGFRRKFRK